MNRKKLYRLAQDVVDETLDSLPADLRKLADECVVDLADRLEEAGDEDGDLLGLFEGNSRLEPEPSGPEELPRVTLFLEALWDFSEGDRRVFRDEVRITLLHELAHYFGFDEDAMAERGLE